MKIQSFGCSFLWGDELQDRTQTWPGIIAKRLEVEHEDYSWPGVGNLYILNQILTRAQVNSVAIINWTFIDRFDFCSSRREKWETLRPVFDHDHAEFYFSNLHGQYRDMLTNLIYVKTAIDFLNQQHIPFVMTYMDGLFFEKVQASWHPPEGIEYLQKYVEPCMKDFQGKNFLRWALDNRFPVSPNLHPLEQAHRSAADLWQQTVYDLTKNIANLS